MKLAVWNFKQIRHNLLSYSLLEVFSIALIKKKKKEIKAEDLKLMKLAAKYENLFVSQVLIECGFIEAKLKNKQLDFETVSQ